jgi:dTDP-glucose 4,6-dehydratase
MRALLTGAGGFIGHHVLEHLLVNTDWEIMVTDSFRHKGKTDRIYQVLGVHPGQAHRVDVITHDLIAPFSPQAAHRIDKLDFIIAMASESHVDRSITDPVPFIQNNVNVMLNTLELARELKPTVVLIVSTDEVYGPVSPGNKPCAEWDAILPSNPYSASKAAQEAIAVSYWRTYGVPVVLTNLTNIFGERQDKEKFLPIVINKVLAGETLGIHGTEKNMGSRYYLHARNAASAWLFLLMMVTPPAFPSASRPARYNIAPLTPVSNLSFAQEIAGVLGKPLKYEFTGFNIKTRPGHDPHYGLDPDKLTMLGWKPPVDFHESLERTVRWTRDHPEWLR